MHLLRLMHFGYFVVFIISYLKHSKKSFFHSTLIGDYNENVLGSHNINYIYHPVNVVFFISILKMKGEKVLEFLYRARITLNSGQVVELHVPRLYTVLDVAKDYEQFGISSIVVLKCRKVVLDGKVS